MAAKDTGVNLLGDKQLNELFNNMLKDRQKRSVVISAFKKASKPMLRTIKANLIARTRAKSSGNLAKSLGTKAVSRLPILRLGARTFGNWKGFHAHFGEFGTVNRYTKSGAARGKITATPWFRPGVEAKSKETAEGFIDSAIESFNALIKRANAKRKT